MNPPKNPNSPNRRAVTRLQLALGSVFVVLSLCTTAFGQGVEFKPVVPDEGGGDGDGDGDGDGETETKEAFVRATISSDRIGLTAKSFSLKFEEAEPKVKIDASRAVTYINSDEPLALVILIQGDTLWMGNETYAGDGEGDDETSKFEGAFTGLASAIDSFTAAGPTGSRGSVIVYSDTAVVKQEFSDLSKMSGAVLGTQKDYQDISKSLVVGLNTAWGLLGKQSNYRKVLVVFGNGKDTNGDATPDIQAAVGKLREAGIESYSIYYNNGEQDSQGQTNATMIGYTGRYQATSRDHFASNSKTIVELVGAKYYVDFPGKGLPWDGEEHELIPVIDDEDYEGVAVVLPPAVFKKDPVEGGLWWLWLLIILAVVLVVVIIIVFARRKPAMAPPPPPMMVDVPPPVDAGPKKTVMFNLGGDGGYPVVGWIIPLSGPNQFQTFKLLHGVTKVGTGGDAHIVIDDGFMSTIHAEVVCKQSGFTLVDGGSTNGSFVNDRKISEHELVDNDQFVLGKTPFKFKSIN